MCELFHRGLFLVLNSVLGQPISHMWPNFFPQNCPLCLGGAGGGLPDNGGPLTNWSFAGSGSGGGIDRSLRRLEAVQRMSVYDFRSGDGDLRGHPPVSSVGNGYNAEFGRQYSLNLCGVVSLELFPLSSSCAGKSSSGVVDLPLSAPATLWLK